MRHLILVLAAISVFALTLSAGPSRLHGEELKKQKAKTSNVNRFNRLFKGAASFNLPPSKDGIHDPETPGTDFLQTPKEAFSDLPKDRAGNRVDWVKALNDGYIEPRFDRNDASKKSKVLDLNIVRQVKGSMPDVVYPHKQHTQWLQCSNCHPKIFIPKKGGNKISMASIMAGQYCGVCHGKVAFPISECRKCHSKNKSKKQIGKRAKNTVKTKKKSAPVPTASVTPVESGKPVKKMSANELIKLGATVYEDSCSGCHGEEGEGVPDNFPPLKGSKITNGPVLANIRVVLDGRVDTSMQSWKEDLNIEEIAAVISFERSSWGNKGGTVQPVQVQDAMVASASLENKSKSEDLSDMKMGDLLALGAEIYKENCSSCHGENGEGVPDAFPAIKGSKIAKGLIKKHLDIVLNGRPDTMMEPWKDELSAREIAAVVTFERNSWDNKAGDFVQPSDVAKAR